MIDLTGLPAVAAVTPYWDYGYELGSIVANEILSARSDPERFAGLQAEMPAMAERWLKELQQLGAGRRNLQQFIAGAMAAYREILAPLERAEAA